MIDGRVVLFRSFPQGADQPPAVTVARLTKEEFEAQRAQQGLSWVSEGSSQMQTLQEQQPIVEQKEFYRPRGRPLEANAVRVKKARFLPDIHAGSATAGPFGNMLDNLQADELVVLQELIDRGDDPWTVINKGKEMVMKGEAVYNIGNHEGMFLAAMAGDLLSCANWLMEGGDAVLSAFPNYSKELNGLSKDGNILANETSRKVVIKVLDHLQKDKRLQPVREFNQFLIQHGKTYQIVDGVMGVHAGIPADGQGNLIPMKDNRGIVLFEGAVGVELLDNMQLALRSGNKDVIKQMFAVGKIDYNTHPMWMRKSFFRVVDNPQALKNMRAQVNAQLLRKYPDGSVQMELIVLGHTPEMVDTAHATTTMVNRALFIDGGFYDDGTQRMLEVGIPDDMPDKVEAIYKDPSGQHKQVLHQGLYALR